MVQTLFTGDDMVRVTCLWVLLIASLQIFSVSANAEDEQRVPEPLRPWIDWVLEGEQDRVCPFFYQDFKAKICEWPGKLTLNLNAQSGQFLSEWMVERAGWIALPGSRSHWPLNVIVNEHPVPVMDRDGKPAVWATPGEYRVQGRFLWERLPNHLNVPPQTALLSLVIDGEPVDHPVVKSDLLWLKSSAAAGQNKRGLENRLDLQVFRKIVDDVPMQMVTHLQLDVSGAARDIVLPHVILSPFIPISVSSPLPAKLEPNGGLRVQVRAGRWQIEVMARHPHELRELSLNVDDSSWPQKEVWVFQTMPYQRVVEVTGVLSVDPTQTNLPKAWRTLPTYQLEQGVTMKLNVIRRGDDQPEPDQLTIKRRLWLDFDGQGYSVADHISGKMTGGWRLNALPQTRLGQVKLNGRNQLITQMPDSSFEGIEVRKGMIEIRADSRVQGNIAEISAVGWQQDFSSVTAELNLPPGWRLLATHGVDNVPHSWLSRWSLLDLFLVLIAAAAVTRLWNIYWGLFAAVTLAILWHEADAPRYVWLSVLLALALIRVLPQGGVLTAVQWYRNLSWLAMLLLVIPFTVNQARIALYPQLENVPRSAPTAPYAVSEIAEQRDAPVSEDKALSAPMSKRSVVRDKSSYYSDSAVNFDRVDPNAKVQTGPGLPQWQWRKVLLSWNGRVDQSQQVKLWYLSPPLTRWLNVLRILCVGVLSLLMLGVLNRSGRWVQPGWSVLVLVLMIGWPIDRSYAAFPSDQMLDELKTRLLKEPPCLPTCAQLNALQLAIDENNLILKLDYDVQENSAVALPGQTDQWLPARVDVDGVPSQKLIRHNNRLWVDLSPGKHVVEIQGRNPPLSQFSLFLPMLPHRVDVLKNEGWRIDGLLENAKTAQQLLFSRLQQVSEQLSEEGFQADALPPFVRIERTLQLGLDWRIVTQISRVAPSVSAVVLAFPLLPGESVLSDGVPVKENKVLVNLPAGQQNLSWQSALSKTERIQLTAADNSLWNEVWKVDASPVWHVDVSGIAVVHHQDRLGRWLPEWRPWPGETVELRITRPQPVPGQILTIDRSDLLIKPGKRLQETELRLQLRSSQGGQHQIRLPKDAELQAVLIDQITQPIRQQGDTLNLPVKPGDQQIEIHWFEKTEPKFRLVTPVIELGSNSVNSHISIELGRDRWVLLPWGPQMGPAALIWGVLIILVLLSIGLAWTKMTPLKHWQWFLLLIGLSQLPIEAAVVVVAWFFLLAFRVRRAPVRAEYFNSLQVIILVATLLTLVLLFAAVQQGLLGSPDMQIRGNDSSAYRLNWYQDRNTESLPTATVFSVPLLSYRILMLLWALWLATSLLRWLKWGWQCFSQDTMWKHGASDKAPASSEQSDAKSPPVDNS